LARIFGLFAILFGSFYLSEGVSWLLRFASGATSRDLFWAQYQSAVILFDLVIGGGSMLAGAGMLLRRQWGRKTWLALLALTVFLHFLMTLSNRAVGIDVSRSYGWLVMVLLTAIISWALLTRPTVKARFR
jgi:uncharacterized membrane protein YkvI